MKRIANVDELKKRYDGYKFKVTNPVLDIGGGDGSFLESQGIKKALILDATKERNKSYDYYYADLTKRLPVLEQKFNTIFLTEVLEHLKNPLYLLAQVHDLLNEEGVCYISIPYTEIGPEHHHVSRWTKKEILEQLNKLGFESKLIQSRRRFGGIGFWLPHCWLVIALKKREVNANNSNIKNYHLKISS
jgi:SAM-dependent methyltransferase